MQSKSELFLILKLTNCLLGKLKIGHPPQFTSCNTSADYIIDRFINIRVAHNAEKKYCYMSTSLLSYKLFVI